MAHIYIEPSRAKHIAQDEMELSRTLKALSQEVDSIRGNMRYKIAGRAQIAERLRQVSEQIAAEAGAARNMGNGLQQIVTWYEKTENGNRDRQAADKTSVRKSLLERILGFIIDPRIFIPVGPGPRPPFNWPSKINWDDILKILQPIPIVPMFPFSLSALTFLDGLDYDTEFSSWESADGRKKNSSSLISDTEIDLLDANDGNGGRLDRLKKWSKNHSKKADGKYYIDGKTGKVTKVDPDDEAANGEFSDHNKGSIPVDIRLAGVGSSNSVSILSGEGELNGNAGGLYGRYAVGEAEYHADAYISALGIGATVGASATAFNAEGKAYLGTENTQAYVEGEVTVGRVGAQAGGSIGLIDKEGNFNPSAYAGGSAEAILAEASGTVGGKFAGTDVSATGKVNFGVGAHANVGVHDGKISFDIGASLGVGVGVKVDIDVSGTVKAIGSGISEVGSFLKKIF